MIRNYLLIALRNMWRNRFFSLINITGLTLGLSVFIIMWIMVRFHLGFDDFHQNKEYIYLLKQTINLGTGEYTASRCGAMQAPAIQAHFPEVRNTVRLSYPFELLMERQPDNTDAPDATRKFIEKGIIAADSSFFDFFTFPLESGDPRMALYGPNSIVITKSMASKYFGEDDALGETMIIEDSLQFTITGIAADPPENSSIQFDFVVPIGFMSILGYDMESYGGTVLFNYFLLNENADPDLLNNKIPDFLKTQYTTDLNPEPFLAPMRSVHLYGEELLYIGVYMVAILAFVILLIAIINFINLSTARSLSRAKEIGVRKVSGARRGQLIFQFLGESILISIIAMNLALFISEQVLPGMTRLLNIPLSIPWRNARFILEVTLIAFMTGMLAGIYPAFLLSSFRPATILRSKRQEGQNPKGGTTRKILVVVQFVFSILFIIATIAMNRQYNHLANADLGLKRDNVLYFMMRSNTKASYSALKTDLLKLPFVLQVTTTSEIPVFVNYGEIEWGDAERKKNVIARILYCGYDFTDAFDVQLAAGRYYSPEFASDSIDGMVINEEVARIMEWDDPIGKEFFFLDKPYHIIGVIRDINFFPFNIGGSALILPFAQTNDFGFISLQESWTEEDIALIRTTYENHVSSYPFEYDFLANYKYAFLQNAKESKMSFVFFSFFGIFVSCLGLLGLTYFLADKRRKEICIRKVFGSTARKVMFLFAGQFARLILIAILIAVPLSYLGLSILVQFFTTRAPLSWWIFAVAAVLTLLVSMFTITLQTIRIAASNPAANLRYE